MQRVYPKRINDLVKRAALRGVVSVPNANGKAASFLCGVSIAFTVRVDTESLRVEDAGFSTNGCGYVVAAAELLCDAISGTELFRLEGGAVLETRVNTELEDVPENRIHCVNLCFDALNSALEQFRKRRITTWEGDDPLVCSCFDVSESAIRKEIDTKGLRSIEEVGESVRAGTGCGSCQMTIGEILDL
ncbi:MAG: hypothetical protein HKN33_15815 [Pyrinomonadaceae bacterium]|nr:hypothetical protein [Pyrinomonadaceae bacterium]